LTLSDKGKSHGRRADLALIPGIGAGVKWVAIGCGRLVQWYLRKG